MRSFVYPVHFVNQKILKKQPVIYVLLICLLAFNCRPEQKTKETASAGTVQATPAMPVSVVASAQPDSMAKSKKNAVAANNAPISKPAAIADSLPENNPSGWPVKGPEPLPGSILPANRVIAFYGNPLSKGMGILGQLEPEKMFAQLDEEVAAWQKADPATPVKPAFHLIMVTAQGKPGAGGKYRLRMSDFVAERVLDWAKQKNALVFLDVQIGQSTLKEELPQLVKFLQLPHVHLGIDAEFAMKPGQVPGRRVGSFDAADINYASKLLADLVTEHQLPPKILVIHRFTRRMITNYKNIKLDPQVQIVMHMDGWGSPALKKNTYLQYIQKEPVQYTGFKIFYKNDRRKKGWRLMTPAEILALKPVPVYIQYQ